VSRRSGLRKSKIPRMIFRKNAVHAFERKVSGGFILNSTNGWVDTTGLIGSKSMQMYFTLGGTQVYLGATPLPLFSMNSGDFTALFDEYQIVGVKLTIFSGFNGHSLSPTNNMPLMLVINDYDDLNSMASASVALEYQNCRTIQMGKENTARGISHYIKPKVQIQTYRTLTSTGYSGKSKQWIDNEQSDVPHYGVKIWLATMNAQNIDFGRCEFVLITS
jgi:hypothetical protein